MREREAKLKVDEGFDVPDLGGMLAGADVSPATERLVEATYYDTDDLQLLRWGYTLRHRKRTGWTIKLPVARTDRVLTRDETDFRGRAGHPLQEAKTLFASYNRGRRLGVIARLHKEHTVRLVTSVARSAVRLITELPVALVGDDPRGVHQAHVATRRLRSDLRTFRERQTAGVDLTDYVGGGAVHGLLDAVVAFATDPPTTPAADRPAADQLPGLVKERWRRLHRAVSNLGIDPEPTALHRVRLRAKRARYAAEAGADGFGEPASRFAKSLAELQDVLGEYTDAIVAERWLTANTPHLDPGAAFAAGRLAQLTHAAEDAARHAWTTPYRRAVEKRNRSWFA